MCLYTRMRRTVHPHNLYKYVHSQFYTSFLPSVTISHTCCDVTSFSPFQNYIVCEQHEKLDVLWFFVKNHLKSKTIVFLSSCKQVSTLSSLFFSTYNVIGVCYCCVAGAFRVRSDAAHAAWSASHVSARWHAADEANCFV